ncbi:uncharacterized protein LOC117641054 [Thrips palmi]|uniref:Uncharacterized protein LOC117641054 n=1 Tax=Thrips palmi TaxID=161013 RepID=A0A6P8ZIR1_THRPL|nr:uncharacterized protein LOC117641054 [Thrips palmi]
MLVLWTILLACAPGGQAAIIPDQVVSFMHILYSTIPVIRKGTDSRVGFGFRFGPHADAQVLLELGPQKRTEQLTQITTTTAGPDDFQFGVGKRHLGDPLHDGDGDALPELGHNHIQGRSQGAILRALRQLWEAGARAANLG